MSYTVHPLIPTIQDEFVTKYCLLKALRKMNIRIALLSVDIMKILIAFPVLFLKFLKCAY